MMADFPKMVRPMKGQTVGLLDSILGLTNSVLGGVGSTVGGLFGSLPI